MAGMFPGQAKMRKDAKNDGAAADGGPDGGPAQAHAQPTAPGAGDARPAGATGTAAQAQNATGAGSLIDARGLLCPLPVLRLRKALAAIPPGQTLRILADDPMAQIDIPHFCTETGHVLIDASVTGDGTCFVVRRQ